MIFGTWGGKWEEPVRQSPQGRKGREITAGGGRLREGGMERISEVKLYTLEIYKLFAAPWARWAFHDPQVFSIFMCILSECFLCGKW